MFVLFLLIWAFEFCAQNVQKITIKKGNNMYFKKMGRMWVKYMSGMRLRRAQNKALDGWEGGLENFGQLK